MSQQGFQKDDQKLISLKENNQNAESSISDICTFCEYLESEFKSNSQNLQQKEHQTRSAELELRKQKEIIEKFEAEIQDLSKQINPKITFLRHRP